MGIYANSVYLSPADYKLLADSLASFFQEKIISLKLSISFKLSGPPSPFDFDKPPTGQTLTDFAPVTPTEVAQLLNSMSNKSSPLDYIPTSLLKSCEGTFSIHISHLANLSFDQAIFPSKFKHAVIAPLLEKPGLSRSDPSNLTSFQTSIPSAKFSKASHSSDFSLKFHFVLVFSLCNLHTANFTQLKPHY